MTNETHGYWASMSGLRRISLVLFIMAIFLGVRSSFTFSLFASKSGLDTVIVSQGRIDWKHRSAPGADYVNSTGPSFGVVILGAGTFKMPVGDEWIWTLLIPFWLIAMLAAIGPGLSLRKFRKVRLRHWRRKWGLCVVCGYDLRGGSGGMS